jgi:hypothetical protein
MRYLIEVYVDDFMALVIPTTKRRSYTLDGQSCTEYMMFSLKMMMNHMTPYLKRN